MKALLIEDHALFREALGLLIGARFPALTLLQAGSLSGGLALLARHPDTDLLLLDLGLPDAQGLDAVRQLRAQAPAMRLVVLSADDRPDTVTDAIALGASGFVPKTARGDVLAHALSTTLAGGVYLPPRALLGTGPGSSPGTAGGAASAATPDAAALQLSPRQAEVLRLLIAGQSNKLICRTLALSESSVKTHIAAVFRRLDVNSRTQAVVAAARLGLQLTG